MTKVELVAKIAKDADITKKAAAAALDSVIATVVAEVKAGRKLALIGFGTFEARKRAARKGRNPQTGAEMKIAAATVPAFRAGKAFKEAVAKKKK